MKRKLNTLLILLLTGVAVRAQIPSLCQSDESGLWGYCDPKDRTKVLIDHQFDVANDFYGDYAVVHKGPLWGIISQNGQEVIPIQYEEAYLCDDAADRALVRKNGQWAFFDFEHKPITRLYTIDEKYNPLGLDEPVAYFDKDELLEVSVDGKWGLIDFNGEVYVDLKYDFVRAQYGFDDELDAEGLVGMVAGLDGKYAIFNKSGEQVKGHANYKDFYGFWFEYAVLKKGKKILFVKMPEAKAYTEHPDKDARKNKLMYHANGRSGLLSSSGEVLVPFEYDYVQSEYGMPYAYIENDNLKGLVKFGGEVLLETNYNQIYVVCEDENWFKVNKNRKYAIFSIDESTGELKQITEFKYSYVSCKSTGVANVRIGSKKGIVDRSGKETWND